jgi:hypothetical protein
MEFTVTDFHAHSITFMAGVLSGLLFFIAVITCITKDEISVETRGDVSQDDMSSDEDELPERVIKRLMGKTT